ncbi:MAG TPA: Rossmann-like and DUF2520 domain-containing protein [Pyrinomonadaceae bacterium]|nr:Rossmann-like and DUF2520 domain-containing protein [Pyrinomonadaceae bacterium]
MPPDRKKRSAKKITGENRESRKAKSLEAKTRNITPKQTSVAIIGAGRLGSALALALSRSGYRIAVLVARRAQRAQLAARHITPRPLALGAAQLNQLPDTDLLLITTPDDQIAEVAARLAEVFAARDAARLPRRRPRRIVLHASGALPSDVLAPLGAHAFSVGSIHPLVSTSDAASGASNLRGAFYCLEGEARALQAARKIVRALGGQSFSVAERDKALYHAAAVITSGHTVALFSLATALLARCGLSEARARQVLLPLLRSTLDNLSSTHAPERALTGTFARADLSTVRKHLAALTDAEMSDALAIYALLGERSLRLAARRKKFAPAVLDEIALLLYEAVKTSLDE